jgi:hypothetical protein
MKTATWEDIDECLSKKALAQQDLETLRAFALVVSPPSTNPAFYQKFNSAKDAIKERIRQIEAEQKPKPSAKDKWHDHPAGKVALIVIGGIIVFVLNQLLKHHFPFLN